MSNRLNILERERERLAEALSSDPHWQVLRRARPDFVRRPSLEGVPRPDAEALAGSALFRALVKVIGEIAALRGAAEAASDAQAAVNPAFRTRVNVKSQPADMALAEAAPRQADDLTAIRRIDRKLAGALNELGVHSFAAIASWDRHEVRRVRDALDLGKRIWRENWIEQAALLDMRAVRVPDAAAVQVTDAARPDTAYPDKGVAMIADPAGGAARLDLGEAAQANANADDAVDGAAGEDTSEAGSDGLAAGAVAALTRADLPHAPPIVLAAVPAPVPTMAALDDEPEDEIEDVAGDRATPAAVPAGERKTIKVGRRPSRLPAPAARRFVYIRGVSDDMADALRSAGVQAIADIAAWTRADVRWFQAILGDDARISRDQWIEQATLLANGGWTNYALKVVSGETRQLVERPEPVVAIVPVGPVVTGDAGFDEPVTEADDAPQASDADVTDAAIEVPAGDALAGDASVDDVPSGAELAATDSNATAVADEPAPKATTVWQAAGPAYIETGKALPDPSERLFSMRGLTTIVALGKIKRPPPDLGRGRRVEDLTDAVPAEPSTAALPDAGRPEREMTSEAPSREASSSGAVAGADPASATRDDVMRDPVAVGPEPDEGIDFGGDHDWDDAEALVIRKIERPPSATAGQEVSVARPDAPPTPLFQRQAVPPPIPPAGTAAAPSSDDDGLWDDDGSDWDSEAEVVIVSRPRAQEADPVAAAPARETAPKARPVIAPIGHGREGGDKGGYDGFLEEATVTIIRAEASETTTSAMFPNKVANDAEKPGAASSQDRRLKQKGLGSRFLKALTGD